MNKLLLLSLLFVCSVGYACESYEECWTDAHKEIEGSERYEHPQNEQEFLMHINAIQNAHTDLFQGISYKLDEISKKLDKPTYEPLKHRLDRELTEQLNGKIDK